MEQTSTVRKHFETFILNTEQKKNSNKYGTKRSSKKNALELLFSNVEQTRTVRNIKQKGTVRKML